ncbi:hypothetical protein B0H16DRAFT_1478305 [Mycena metata]|uniref:Uncharacterized protein n=1 Tax=Mycena metata TaxID=1033252 RepID=A0AAD7MFB5_9AGAR|nr:hypothetical protein B0H16DRAFT_1478305 [Mycena metata]
MDVPAGGLSRFLRQNLRFKVFLVAISILEDRWATRTRTSITTQDLHEARVCYYAARVRQNEFHQNFSRHNTPTQASWMFYLIGVLLYAVGFDGDDAPEVQGVNVFNLAVSQAEFFSKECAETVALFRVSKQAIFLDYEEYNPHRTVEPIFVSRQPPRNFKRIAVNDAAVLDFSTEEINSPVWTNAQRVVEATLVALSRVDGALLVETDSEGKVIGVQKESVEGLLADMVDSPPERGHQADCLQGGSGSRFCRSASPTLCADEEACGRELSEWSVSLLYKEKACMLRPHLISVPVFVNAPIHPAMSDVYCLPRIALDSNFYGIEEACKLVNEYALETALRFEPGSHTRDKLDDVMERYICPSIHLLDCALRPANTGWLHRHELTMIELIVVHDTISNIMGFLATGFSPAMFAGKDRKQSAHQVIPSPIQLNLSRALMIGRAWNEVEDQMDFPSFLLSNTEQIFLGLGDHMTSTLSPPTNPVGIVHLIGSPAGRALATRVEGACRMIQPLEISDQEYTEQQEWAPPISVSLILCQVLRPAVFVLQQALDPSFHRTGYGPFEFPFSTTRMVQHSIRKLMELVHLISLTDPEYPSYVALWDGLEHLKRVATCWAALLGTRGEYPKFERSGRMIRRPVNTGFSWFDVVLLANRTTPTQDSFALPSWMLELETVIHELSRATPEERLRQDTLSVKVPKWRAATKAWYPSHTMGCLLEYAIRPQVYLIQSTVDPGFTLATPFPPMKATLTQEVRAAIRRVLDQLVFPPFPTRKLLHDSRPHFVALAKVARNAVQADNTLVPGASSNMFRILRVLICEVGYDGDEDGLLQTDDPIPAFQLFEITALESRSSLAHNKEFPDYNFNGSSYFASYYYKLSLAASFNTPAAPFKEMALCFALPRDYHRGDPMSFRSRTQFKVFFIDLDTEEDLVRFLRQPEVTRFSQQILAPLRDQVMAIGDCFHLAPPVTRDSPWIRFQTSIYMYFLRTNSVLSVSQSFIRQAIVPDERGVSARRIPTPSVASLLYMMRLSRRFGFEGDNEATRASSAEDNLLVVFNHARETIFGMATRLASSRICFSNTFSEIQMTPPQVVGPYAQLIDKGFPTRAIVKHQVHPESVEFLTPHIGELLRFLGLAYVIALEIASNYGPPMLFPTEAIRTLTLMQKFDGILGSPTYEVGPALQSIIMSWLKLMIGCTRQRRISYTDPIDIPLVRDLAHVPCVPSWTVKEIATLQEEEHNDPWVAEKYWLSERVQACNRTGKELSDVLADVAGAEWYPSYFFMSSVPITQTSDLLAKLHSILPPATGSRIEPSLRALWVSQIRNLCQGIHETIGGRIFTEFPAPLRDEIRIAVKILLSNICRE